MGLFSSSSEAIGLFIDDRQVQAAHLKAEGSRIVLVGLEMASLVHPLRLDTVEPDPVDETDENDILGFAEEDFAEQPEPVEIDSLVVDDDESEPTTNLEVFNRLLGKFPVARCRLGVSLLNGCVHFKDISVPEGMKGRKLEKHLTEIYRQERMIGETDTLDERHVFIPITEGTGLSILQEDPLEILGILDELSPFLGKIQVGVIDPFELSLIHTTRLAGHGGPEITAIVFVGEDRSTLIFTKDGHYLALSRPINEGYASPNLMHTISRRILFEQDVSNVPTVDRIVLAGECRTIDAKAYFEKTLPSATVEYLSIDTLTVPDDDESRVDMVSTYAVPIGLAWKALRPADPSFYPTNFLPKTRRRQQNPLEIAWHGLMLIVLLAGATLLFGVRAQEQDRTISQLHLSVDLLQKEIAENALLVAEVRDLQTQIRDYRRNFALLDTLSTRKHTWNDRLREISEITKSTGHTWLTRLSTSESGIDLRREWNSEVEVVPKSVALAGVARYVERVARLADRLGDGHIESIETTEIREARVHSFRLKTPSWVKTTSRNPDR